MGISGEGMGLWGLKGAVLGPVATVCGLLKAVRWLDESCMRAVLWLMRAVWGQVEAVWGLMRLCGG